MQRRKPNRARRSRRRTLRVLVEYLSDAGLCRDAATTLGAGGLFIETERPLDEGAILKLHFRLPGTQLDHEIEGRVVWNCKSGEGGYPGFGVEFTDRVAASRLACELEAVDD